MVNALVPVERLLTVAEVARELRVCPATVYKLAAKGELPHVRVSNAIRVVPRMPETFALTRVVWRDAFTSKTCFTGIWFARAMATIGSLISGFVSGL